MPPIQRSTSAPFCFTADRRNKQRCHGRESGDGASRVDAHDCGSPQNGRADVGAIPSGGTVSPREDVHDGRRHGDANACVLGLRDDVRVRVIRDEAATAHMP